MNKLTTAVLFLALTACQTVENKNKPIEEVKLEITEIITAQANAWNSGDMETFMQAYWKSDSLRFMSSGKITYGWQGMLDGYKKGYPDKESIGELKFELISLEYLGAEHLLMLGEFHISREKDLKGKFSLIWKIIDGEWKIIFDHT